MSVKLSTGLKDAWLGGGGGGGSLVNLLRDGVARIYSGSQPANADAVETGTLLLEISASSGAFTGSTSSDVELTFAGASGSVDTVKVGGMDENLLAAAVSFDTDLGTTATAVAASINGKPNALGILAAANTPSSGDVMLYAPAWMGALGDNLTVAVTCTTMTVDIDNAALPSISGSGVFAGGVTAVNGINFDVAASGAISKDSGETWSDAGIAAGVAGWLRFYDSTLTTGASTTAKRLDMSVGTVGTDAIMDSTTVAIGATSTVTSASLSL
jgi:hypothetical protein